MFFKRKNHDSQCQRLEDQLSALSQDADAIKQKLELLTDLAETVRQYKFNTMQTMDQLDTGFRQHLNRLDTQLSQHFDQMDTHMTHHLNKIETHFSQMHSDVHKHDMAIEDLLDEWAEKKSDEDDIKAHLKEAGQTEKLLLELFEAYQEQFWNLKHYAASKDESWSSQISLMEKNLEHCRRSCTIHMIQDCGVSVDYDLHEVIEAIDTTDPSLDKTVAQIYRCGYLYKGKVIKKAQAAAYRFSDAAQKKC